MGTLDGQQPMFTGNGPIHAFLVNDVPVGADPLAATPPLLSQSGPEEPSSTTDELTEVQEGGGRALGEWKVQDLKNECKKRHLAVSGSKQQLLDRLRPFHCQILLQQLEEKCNSNSSSASSPPFHSTASPPMASTNSFATVGSSSVIDAVINSVIDGSGSVERKTGGKRTAKSSSKLEWRAPTAAGGVKAKQAKGKQERKKGQQQKEGTLADLLRGGNAQQMMAAALGPKLLLGDRKEAANSGCCACSEGHGVKKQMAVWTPAHSSSGGVEKETRGNALSNEMALQERQMDGQMLMTTSAANHSAAEHPFEAMTFSFAQMGSGGQFTPMEPAEIDIVPMPTPLADCRLAEGNGGGAKKANAIDIAPLLMPCLAERGNQMAQASAPPSSCQCRQQPTSLTPQPSAGSVSLGITGDEFAGRQAGVVSRRRHSIPIGEAPAGWDPSELMSATTLARHEEMLRQQQRRIVDLQRELGRSQQALQQHQQMLADARRAAQPRDPETGRLLGQVEFWLGQLEAGRRLLESAHREQQLLMDRQMAGQRALVCAEQRLQEELHTEQAVQDICRLIRQEPKAALLIVQLLRRYQLERVAPPEVNDCTAAVPKMVMVNHEQAPAAPSVPLWNGFLSAAAPLQTKPECTEQMASQPMIADAYKNKAIAGRKRTAKMRTAEGQQQQQVASSKRNGPAGRSNSVLDGLTGQNSTTSGCSCAARRPNSSLGTETVEGGRSVGPVDMEEIFRSVLEGSEQTKQRQQQQQQQFQSSDMLVESMHSTPPDEPMPLGIPAQGPPPPPFAPFEHSQEMEKTMQDLMEVLRDDQEKCQMIGRDCPSSGAHFRTDQLATFLAEEVELCRNASGATSAILPAQGQAVAVGSVRLGIEQSGATTLTAFPPQQCFGQQSPMATDLMLFQGPDEADRTLDWLDGFDSFTAVF